MAIDREFGPNAGVQYYRRILAYVHCIQGEYARADELFRGSLRYHMEVDNSPIAASLAGFGALRRAQGELKVAASLCGKVTSMLGSKGRQLRPIELEQFDHTVASLRAQLPRSDYDAAWVEGQALTLEQAIALALGDDGM